MVEQRQVLHSGGCQCGAVRYALYAEPYDTHICHCRMCQKAFGAYYAPLTKMRYKDFAWTRGEPSIFQSSPDVDRGFCSTCGTPLTFAHKESDYLNMSTGSLDQPERVKPDAQQPRRALSCPGRLLLSNRSAIRLKGCQVLTRPKAIVAVSCVRQ